MVFTNPEQDKPQPKAPTMQGIAAATRSVKAEAPAKPFDVMDFVTNHRIHIEHGSLILPNEQSLPLHPRELHPSNEAPLKQKIRRVYMMDDPEFFEDKKVKTISSALAGYIPLSIDTKKAKIRKEVEDLMKEIETGVDPKVAKRDEREKHPYASTVNEFLHKSPMSPEQAEFSKNAVAMYVMFQEALKQRGYTQPLTAFLSGVSQPDGLMVKLGNALQIDPQELIDTASHGGVNAVGRKLGLSNEYLQEVGELVTQLPQRQFSANLVRNWMIGRNIPGFKNAGINEKADIGAWARVNAKIASARQAVNYHYETPAAIQQTEKMVANALSYLPPQLAETLHLLGAEFVYSPAGSLGPMLEGNTNYGFHRRLHTHPDDTEGTYLIYLSGKTDAEAFLRVAMHEAHHLIFPGGLTHTETAKVDALANSDMLRLKALGELMDKWFTGDETEKQQALATLNRPEFAVAGKPFSQIIRPEQMQTFYTQVKHANERLQIEGSFYQNSGYKIPELRFLEVNSRYAELRHVRLRENPEMLQFIVPGLTEAYDTVYMPHVTRQLEDLRQREALKQEATRRMTASATPPGATMQKPQPIANLQAPQPVMMDNDPLMDMLQNTGKPGDTVFHVAAAEKLYHGGIKNSLQ